MMRQPIAFILVAVLLQMSPCVAAGVDMRPAAGTKDLLNTRDGGEPAVAKLVKAGISGSKSGSGWAYAALHARGQANRTCQPAPDAERDLAILRVTLARHPDYVPYPQGLVLLKGLVEASGCSGSE
jgi:hypothetical protein